MGSNIENLGNILNDRMKKVTSDNRSTVLELGRINANMSLSTDSLFDAIPKGEYMVSSQFKTPTRTSESEGHSHTVSRSLKAGDRVLVAWARNEPIVIDVVTSS